MAPMPIDRPRHATTINCFLCSLYRIEESGARTQRFASSHSRPHPPGARRGPMTTPLTFPYKRYGPAAKLAFPRDRSERDVPLRAKSVCLTERPRSKYVRSVRSADTRSRYSDKQYFHQRPRPPPPTESRQKPHKVLVKQQNRKVIDKVPCAISIQTLSIPMKYADTKNSTSKTQNHDCRTKSSNPPKQVGDNKRLCSTVCGKGTENKLLLQISEAEQVSDFERILNSNAILSERARGNVWRGCVANAPSASVVPRPRSSYSLHTVSQAYHYLFRQHEDSLQPLIDRYRQAAADDHKSCPAVSILQDNWYENLQDLSEFYEDDQALRQEIETITDRIITEEVKAEEKTLSSGKNKNFNVNLTDLIGLRVNGEGYSPISTHDGPSPDVEKGDNEVYENDAKEWLGSSMSANSNDRQNSQDQNDSTVDCVAQSLNTITIDSDAKVPTITFSNCCDGRARSDLPDNSEVVIHLTVPSVDSIDEARPPMM